MSTRLSRRQLAQYAVERLREDDPALLDMLAAYLIDTGRTKEARSLVVEIERVLKDEGVVVAHIDSAFGLDDKQMAEISDLLKKHFKATEVIYNTNINPSLLGGFVARTADEELDGSLRKKIDQLKAINV